MSAPDDDIGVDVGGRGIDQRDAGGHELFVLLLADHGADLCKFGTAVDAADFVGALDGPGRDRALLLAIDRDEIGQVVLALFVRGADRVERGEQRGEVERVDAGIDFGDRLLRGGGVALLDDLRDLAAACGRCGRSRTAAARFAVITVAAAAASWCVASSAFSESTVSNGTSPDSSTTVPLLPSRSGRVCSSAWPVPSCCSCVTNCRRVRFASDALHLVGAVADDQRDARRLQCRGGPDHALDDRQAANLVQDLGQLRLHPGALAGGQDNDVYVIHARGIQTSILIRA